MINTTISICEKIKDELLARLKVNFFTQIINVPGAPIDEVIDEHLIPELKTNTVSGMDGNEWVIVKFKPGINPIQNLTSALLSINKIFLKGTVELDNLNTLRNTLLENGSSGLNKFYHKAKQLRQANFNLLLIIEDFESLFLYKDLQNQAGLTGIDIDFIGMLLRSVVDKNTPIYLLTGLYPQFNNQTLRYQGYAELVHKGKFNLPTPHLREIQENFQNHFDQSVFSNRLFDAYQNTDLGVFLKLFLLNELNRLESKRPDLALLSDTKFTNLQELVNLVTVSFLNNLTYEELQLFRKIYQQLLKKNKDGVDAYKPIKIRDLALILFDEKQVIVREEELVLLIEKFNNSNFNFLRIDQILSRKSKEKGDLIVRIAEHALPESVELFSKWENEERINQTMYENVLKEGHAFEKTQNLDILYSGYELKNALSWLADRQPNYFWIKDFQYQKAEKDLSPLKIKEDLTTIEEFLKISIAREKEIAAEEKKAAQKKQRRFVLISLVFLAFSIMSGIFACDAERAKARFSQTNSNFTYFSFLEKLNKENRLNRLHYLNLRKLVLDKDTDNEIVKIMLRSMIEDLNVVEAGEIIQFGVDLIGISKEDDEVFIDGLSPLIENLDTLYKKRNNEYFESSLFYSLTRDILAELEIRNGKRDNRFILGDKGNLDLAIDRSDLKKFFLLNRLGEIIQYIEYDTEKAETILLTVNGLTNITFGPKGEYLFGVTDKGEVYIWEDKDGLPQFLYFSIEDEPYLKSVRSTDKSDRVIAVADNSFYIVERDYLQHIIPSFENGTMHDVQTNKEGLVVVCGENFSMVYDLNNLGYPISRPAMRIEHHGKLAIACTVTSNGYVTLAFSEKNIALFPYKIGTFQLEALPKILLPLGKKYYPYSIDSYWGDEDPFNLKLTLGSLDKRVYIYDIDIENFDNTTKFNRLELRGNTGTVFEVDFNNKREVIALDENFLVFYPSSIETCWNKINFELGLLKEKLKDK